jgi:hypothetical protein
LQTRLIAPFAAATVLAVLCGAALASSGGAGAPVVTVVMTKTGPTIAGPTTWHPGLVRIAARSRVADQEVTLLHFRTGYSYANFVADGAKANGRTAAAHAALRRVFANTVFDGGVDLWPGQSADFAVAVRPGTYYLGEMTRRPQLKAIHVAGSPTVAAASSAAVVTATDSGYRIEQGVLPARGTITVSNAGSRPHRLNLIPVRRGTTRAQLGAYLRKTGARDNAPPPAFALDGPQLGTADISPHAQMQLMYKLPAGDYALIDFNQDLKSGRPESLEGLYAVATLR